MLKYQTEEEVSFIPSYVSLLGQVSKEYVPTGEFRVAQRGEYYMGTDGKVWEGRNASPFMGARIIMCRVEKEIEIDGKKYSESTIKNALREYID